MQQIVECVPNFSDGRNPKVYDGIAEAIRSVRGVQVLDVSADPDHNRTVITYVGAPSAAEEAAFRAIAKAAQLINLEEHEGEHPRIGATDVFPFVPVKGISTEECVAIAHRLGKRVGEELGIAVYLYASAATQPGRVRLAAIRKGEYEAWKAEVAEKPERRPDYGPAEPKSWGATVIGVRPFLIAYNIYLNSSDVDIADRIARSVRFVSGGLRFVQAKGFLVEGQAQVSMNLTNFERTPLHRVQEMVRREASRHGLSITKAELIGLIPQSALIDSAKWYLQLDGMQEDQVLEIRLAQEEGQDTTPSEFLEATADTTPTPGGGSAAALAGAVAASLTQMVAGLTEGRKKYADHQEEVVEIRAKAIELRRELTDAIHEDAAAFDRLMSAYRVKDLEQSARAELIEHATIGAAEVPLRVARLSRDVAQLAQSVTRLGNVNAVTDSASAAIMARAAVQAAALNVKVNVVGLRDQAMAQRLRTEVEALEAELDMLATETVSTAAERGKF